LIHYYYLWINKNTNSEYVWAVKQGILRIVNV
jgi:hypothetical protein